MERYNDNGFCDYLKEKYVSEEHSEIKFFNTDKSLLAVASKSTFEPLCMIIDDRIESDEDANTLSKSEAAFGNQCYTIACKARLPLFWIRYVDRDVLTNEDFVHLWHMNSPNGQFQQTQLKELPQLFGAYGIEAQLENKTPQKKKNDSLSSAFHYWQRECLRVGIFADLDLIRIHGGEMVELIELKRSTKDFNVWQPYQKDINNYAILSRLCERLGQMDFHIVFNAQIPAVPQGTGEGDLKYYRKIVKKGKGDYYDKIDVLKVYRVEPGTNPFDSTLPGWNLLGTIGIEDYLEYETYADFTEKAVN